MRPAWATWGNPVSTENTKISLAWWHAPVIPATQEAEALESLEPGRQRLQWVEIAPLHSSLCDRVRLCLKKKKKKNRTTLVFLFVDVVNVVSVLIGKCWVPFSFCAYIVGIYVYGVH